MNDKSINRIKFDSINKKYTKLGLLGVLIIFAVLLFVFIRNPVNNYKGAIKDNKYVEATKVYDEKIKGDRTKEKEVSDFLTGEIEDATKSYSENKQQYTESIMHLEAIEKTGLCIDEVTSAKKQINALNDSRTTFKKGVEFYNNHNLKEALIALDKVIPEDSNYTQAKELINNSTNEYKTSALTTIQSLTESKEFDKALNEANQAIRILPNDQDLVAKVAVLKKAMINNLISNQELSVVTAKITKDWIGWDQVEILVKNSTVVKEYSVNWMCFDKDGYPIRTGFGGIDYLDKGISQNTVQPGAIFGHGYSWQTNKDTGAKTVLACVYNVKYYDDSEWTNPYYKYWEEEYLEKPLQ